MSQSKPKILILTAPIGGGHVATANNIAAAIERYFPDRYQVEVDNILRHLKVVTSLDKIAIQFYSGSVSLLNSYPWRLFFKFSDANAELLNKFFSTVFKEQGVRYFKRKNPDLLVTTFPILSYGARRLMGERLIKRVPVINILTDAGDVHNIWYGDEDAVLVSTPETIAFAVEAGVDRHKLHDLGFPVDERFVRMQSRQQARRALGLDEDRPTVLLSGGGLGLSNKLIRLAKRLSRMRLGAQYVFMSGRNQVLKDQLEQIKFNDPVKVYGYVDNVPQLMAAADLVVGKAGWLSLNEAMIARRPNIIIDVIPGQEEPNAQFVESHGVGKVLKEPAEAALAVVDLVTHPEKLDDYQKAFDKLGLDPESNRKIAEFIIGQLHGEH